MFAACIIGLEQNFPHYSGGGIKSYSFNDRIKVLTEMYCSHQYLSVDPKKVCHKHQKIGNMNADISKTI